MLNERGEQAAILREALLANLALAAVLAALLLACLAAGVLNLGTEPAAPVVLGAIACATLGLNAAAKGGLQGLLSLTTVATASFLEVGVKLVLGLLLAAFGWGATGAAVGILAGTATGTAVTLGTLQTRGLISTGPWWGWRFSLAFYRETLPMFFAMGGMAVLASLDVFAVKVLSPSGASNTNVAFYQVAVTLARVPYFFGSALTAAVFPHIARHHSDKAAASLYLRKALFYLVTFLAPIGLTFILAPESTLSFFFPRAYVAAAPVLQVLSVGGVALAAALVLMGALQAVGLAKTAALASAAMIAVELGLLPVVVSFTLPRGAHTFLVAIAVVFDAVSLTLVAALLFIARSRFFHWQPRYRGVVGLGLSALAFSTVLLLLPHAGRVQLLAALAVAGAVYCLMLIALRVLSRGDMAVLWSGVALQRRAART